MLNIKTLLLSFFIALTAFPAFSQAARSSVSLSWERYESVLPIKGRSTRIPICNDAFVSATDGLPHYTLQFNNQQISSFRLVNAVYEPFSEADAKLLPKDFKAAEPEVRLSTGTANRRPVSQVSFIPIRRNPATGRLEKLTRFDYEVSHSGAAQRGGAARSRLYAKNSVLSSGNWHKIGITGSGMYKIDRAALLRYGIDPNTINPQNIRIYGYGGMLPQANAAPRHDDLVENTIFVSGEADGRFDADDYILFYGQGPDTWKFDIDNQIYQHQKNIFSDSAYYFITVGTSPGKRVMQAPAVTGNGPVITQYLHYWYHELEKTNVLKSGRAFFGEEFNSFTTTHTFDFNVQGLVPNSQLKLLANVMGNSPDGCRFDISLNGRSLPPILVGPRGTQLYHEEGIAIKRLFDLNLASLAYTDKLSATLRFHQGQYNTSNGYLDFLVFNAQRELQLYGNQTSFRSTENIGPGNVSTFQIGNVQNAGSMVWDVTQPWQATAQTLRFTGNTAAFTANTDTLRQYVVFSGNNFPVPASMGRVQNQNLHSFNLDGELDLLIITHPALLGPAQRFANYRRDVTGMQVEVATTNQIYNEFSSGAQDITALRDFVKMLYERIDARKKGPDSLLYVLLLGDASFDYKDFRNSAKRNEQNTNLVPIYESYESLDPIRTYSSDDYIGFLDDHEGQWAEPGNVLHLLDVGIGRLPARNEAEANNMINKIMRYEQPSSFGKWRNKIAFVCDDSDPGIPHEFLNDSEKLTTLTDTTQGVYNLDKIYLDLFPQYSVANGQRSSAAVAALDKAIEQGSLIMNYIGHGGETGWAGEQILTVPQINNWKNADRLTFMLTATCEFGRYDDPYRASGAEYALLNPQGGAIGLITTTRPVYSSTNYQLNRAFFNTVYNKGRLGDIIAYTKNNNSSRADVYNRNFALLGDPSMRLAYPELEAEVLKINGLPPAADTIRALSKATLEGVVKNNGQIASDFNGQVQLTIYEKTSTLQTLGDEGAPRVNVTIRENIIYDGIASVQNGTFKATFVVPKDISYNFGTGKISLYAFDKNNRKTDAAGYNQDIIIGGSSNTLLADTEGPIIKPFMNDETFVNGGITGRDAKLLMLLEDSSGINTAGIGIGHEITATLDGNKENVQVLNDYYTAEVDNYQKGKVEFMFKNLSDGPHTLRLKAWDTYNNSSEEQIEFIVANHEKLALKHVLNYPNPFSTNTTFHFDHNRAGDDLEIMVQIFTVSGKLIRTLNTTSFASKTHFSELQWNGRDEFDDVLAKGVYVYKITVRSMRDGSKTDKFEKLVILN